MSTQSPEYDATKARLSTLTDQQVLNVHQRVRALKAIVGAPTYLLALNAAIDLELSGRAPLPTPCPEHPTRASEAAAVPRRPCLQVQILPAIAVQPPRL